MVVHPDDITAAAVAQADEHGWDIIISSYCPRGRMYILNPDRIMHPSKDQFFQ